MFHSRAMEPRKYRIHERTLRLVYPNQHQLTFKEVLEKNKTVSIHKRNLQTLATEICKAKNKIFPDVLNLLFEFTNKSCSLRNVSVLKRKRCFTIHYGEVENIREVKTWSIFKNEIKALTTDKRPCRLFKNYLKLFQSLLSQ